MQSNAGHWLVYQLIKVLVSWLLVWLKGLGVRVMKFNTIFNNISVISWWPVLLEYLGNHWPAASHRGLGLWVLNTTYNNISVISCQSILIRRILQITSRKSQGNFIAYTVVIWNKTHHRSRIQLKTNQKLWKTLTWYNFTQIFNILQLFYFAILSI